MNRHILDRPIANLYLAPDIDPGGLNVPVIPAAAPKVTEVQLPSQPAIENSPAVKAVKPAGGVKGPQDFGEESADDSRTRMGLAKDSPRGPDGRFLPKGQKEAAKPAPKAGEKPAEPAQPPGPPKATPVAQKPAAAKPAPTQAQPAAQPQAPVTKVKIGGEEKTAEEWEKSFKDLQAKAKSASDEALKALAPEPKESPKPAPTPEEAAAAQKARETKFLADTTPSYAIAPEEWDRMLADPNGGQMFAQHLAKAEMRGRQFTAHQLEAAYKEIDGIREEFKPLLESHGQVARIMEEHAVLAANPELKDNPKGAETFRKISAEMRDGRAAIEKKIASGTASGTERGWALQYDDMTQDQRNEAAAEHAKTELAKIHVEQAKPTHPPQLKVMPPAERPLSADRPGGQSVSRTETSEQRIAREALAAAGM